VTAKRSAQSVLNLTAELRRRTLGVVQTVFPISLMWTLNLGEESKRKRNELRHNLDRFDAERGNHCRAGERGQ
jgi:hypothetical protein